MSARAAQALATAVDALEPAGPEAWRFRAEIGGAVLTGRAVLDGDWLDLTVTPTATGRVLDDWCALEWNATLPAGVRLVATAAHVGLRADVPIAADADAAASVRAAVEALATAAGLGGAGDAAATPATTVPSDDTVCGLLALTGFASAPRGAEGWTVDLAVPNLAERAVVRRASDATLAVSVALVDDVPAALSEVARRAVARLLGRVATQVRLARPAVDVGAPASLRFEVLGVQATATDLAHACGALAAACSLAAVETAALLRDEALARLYLGLDSAAAEPRAA